MIKFNLSKNIIQLDNKIYTLLKNICFFKSDGYIINCNKGVFTLQNFDNNYFDKSSDFLQSSSSSFNHKGNIAIFNNNEEFINDNKP